VDMLKNFPLPQNAGNLLSAWANIGFWRRTQLHGVSTQHMCMLILGKRTHHFTGCCVWLQPKILPVQDALGFFFLTICRESTSTK
jgi:hypothetical protein